MLDGHAVRAMQADDLPRVCELNVQLGYAGSLETMRARFERIARREQQGLFVALHRGEVAGWLHVQTESPLETDPYAEIMGLIVAESARRSGLGRALVERARQWASGLGVRRLRVRCNVRRSEAHAFYATVGFRLLKTQHNYVIALEGPLDEAT